MNEMVVADVVAINRRTEVLFRSEGMDDSTEYARSGRRRRDEGGGVRRREQQLRNPLDRLLNSLVIVGILTEMLVHAANDWTNRDNSRYIIFNCHNSLWAQWHCTNMDHKTIVKMPPKRQSLSKGTWQLGKDDN